MSLALAYCSGPAALVAIVPPPQAAAASPVPPAAVWLLLARRAVAAQSQAEALRCFENALRHEPTLALAHLGRAIALAQMGREAEAEAATEALLACTRGQEEALYQLARMCAREGRVGLGVALLTRALHARPELDEKAARESLFADHPAYLQALGRL